MAPAECPGGTIKTVKVPDAWDPQHPNVKGLCTTTRSRGHAYRMEADTGEQGLPGPGQGPARLHRQPGRLVRVHHRVALPGRRHHHHERRRHRQPLARRLRRGRRPRLADRQGRQGLRHQPQPQRLLAAQLRPRRLAPRPRSSSTTPRSATAAAAAAGPTTKTTRTPVTKELAGDAAGLRWWRVVSTTGKNKDGHPRSLRDRPRRAPPSTRAAASPSTTSTSPQYNKCEQFASNNLRNCGAGPARVRRQVGQRPDAHPPGGLGQRRASTTSPGTRTSSRCRSTGRASQLAPRDVTAMNPLTPAAARRTRTGMYEPR